MKEDERKDCAKVTISKRTANTGGDRISIKINDNLSGDCVVSVDMSLEAFAQAVTGLSYMEANYDFCPTAESAGSYRRRRIVKTVFCEKVSGKENQLDMVYSDFTLNWLDDDENNSWELQDDGTRSQQNGVRHKYIIKKYVDKSDN